VDQTARYVLIGSAAVTGLMLLAWGASRAGGEPWADEWQLFIPVVWTVIWLLLWRAVRQRWFKSRWLAPRPQRYAREHPAVQELAAEGWEQRDGPL